MAPLAAAISVAGSMAGGSNGVVGASTEYPMGETSGSSPGAPGVGRNGGGSDGGGGSLREAAPRVGGGGRCAAALDEEAAPLAAADPLGCAAGCSNASLAA